jgi:hypothetical protein
VAERDVAHQAVASVFTRYASSKGEHDVEPGQKTSDAIEPDRLAQVEFQR